MKTVPVKTLTELGDKDRIEQLRSIVGDERPPGSINPFFGKETFDLLNDLHEKRTAQFYNEHSDEFRAYLEEPFRNLFVSIAERLPESITGLMETEKRLFSRIAKNDWGRGGAWDYYWGAFYPKGGKRIADPQLFVFIAKDILRFGFYVGDYGAEARKRFAKNCREHLAVLKLALEPSLSDKRLIFCEYEDSEEQPSSNRALPAWDKWLADPESFGMTVAVVLSAAEVQRTPRNKLIESIEEIFKKLFPLVLLACKEDPLIEINRYLESESSDSSEINPEYPIEKCAGDTHFPAALLQRWTQAIETKKQAILYGPPGTGKTFLAEKLARHLIGGGDGFQETIQFHPSYAYEDFMQGLRPKATSEGRLEYVMVPGRFLDFCSRARDCSGRCVLIIDEINRANLSRVLGELMYLLEYREAPMPLAGGENFKIPGNVIIIGTMNTADRSIALVDHALRRRFAFLGLYPDYDVLRGYHQITGFDPTGLISVLERLNGAINDKHYSVGISFFLHPDINSRLQNIWQMEIEPYIDELFCDQQNKAEVFCWEKIKNEILQA
jgi:5-methylcytosine-specific restriction protein B